jgi:hypothetical protein
MAMSSRVAVVREALLSELGRRQQSLSRLGLDRSPNGTQTVHFEGNIGRGNKFEHNSAAVGVFMDTLWLCVAFNEFCVLL